MFIVLLKVALAPLYYLVVTPIAFMRRMAGNPLAHQVKDLGYWHKRSPESNTRAAMRRSPGKPTRGDNE